MRENNSEGREERGEIKFLGRSSQVSLTRDRRDRPGHLGARAVPRFIRLVYLRRRSLVGQSERANEARVIMWTPRREMNRRSTDCLRRRPFKLSLALSLPLSLSLSFFLPSSFALGIASTLCGHSGYYAVTRLRGKRFRFCEIT